MVAALGAACRDGVLAVRLAAAVSLAAFCLMLSQEATAAAAAGGRDGDAGCGAVVAAGRQVLGGCLRLGVAVAEADNEKVRPSGLQALGSLFGLLPHLALQFGEGGGEAAAAVESSQEVLPLVAAAAQAVQQGLSCASPKVQWAACEAAADLLACSAAPACRHAPAVAHQLVALLAGSPNFRSRALAAAALRRATVGALPSGGAAQFLDAVAAQLFQGIQEGSAGLFVLWPSACKDGGATLNSCCCHHLMLTLQGKHVGLRW